jgi:hypothetical protein
VVADEGTHAFGQKCRLGTGVLLQANAFILAHDAKGNRLLISKKVAQVFAEGHGNACKVADGGHDAPGFELGEERGGEAGLLSHFDQAHGSTHAETADPFTDLLGLYGGFNLVGFDYIDGIGATGFFVHSHAF